MPRTLSRGIRLAAVAGVAAAGVLGLAAATLPGPPTTPLGVTAGASTVGVGVLAGWLALRTDRDRVAALAREATTDRAVEALEEAQVGDPNDDHTVLVAIRGDITDEALASLLQVGAEVAEAGDGPAELHAVRFARVPSRRPITGVDADDGQGDADGGERDADGGQGDADSGQEDADGAFASSVSTTLETVPFDGPVHTDDVVRDDPSTAAIERAAVLDADVLVTSANRTGRIRRFLGGGADRVKSGAPCDVALVQPGMVGDRDEIAVVTDRSPYFDPLKLRVGAALASVSDARLRLCFAAGVDAPQAEVDAVRSYHAQVDDAIPIPVESTVVRANDTVEGLRDTVSAADLVVVGTSGYVRFRELLIPPDERRLAESIEQPAVLCRPADAAAVTSSSFVDRVLYGSDPVE